jgi:hypothetical protein
LKNFSPRGFVDEDRVRSPIMVEGRNDEHQMMVFSGGCQSRLREDPLEVLQTDSEKNAVAKAVLECSDRCQDRWVDRPTGGRIIAGARNPEELDEIYGLPC